MFFDLFFNDLADVFIRWYSCYTLSLFANENTLVENSQRTSRLDTELLQGYVDSLGKSIVEQMFTLYCQQAALYLKDIEAAQISQCEESWQEHCHKMKGASASVGMSELHQQLKVLEKVSATQQEKSSMLTELKLTNQQAINTFKTWLANC